MRGTGRIVCGLFALSVAGGVIVSVSAQELESDTLKVCEKQLKSKNPAESFAAAWRLAGHYRAKGELKTAEKILKDIASTRDFERLPQAVAIEKLRCILEMAHVKAIQEDVNGSLALLNWAEQRKDEFQRSVSLIKYAEILLDLGEFERGGEYQKSGDKLIVKNLGHNPDGAAIGQGGKGVDKSAAWHELKLKSDDLARELEFEMLKQKYGASYALYVKLRRCQYLLKKNFIPRYRKEAFAIADEIIEADPKSQFAEAAKYLKCAILAARLTDESDKKQIKEAKDYLEKFVKENPDGLYRGEALMLLGRISMECEWNAKESEKYYKDALAYFQKARTKRDTLSLYAPMSDELKKQSEPTQKPTTLNEWKRIVYHDEDPLKLYNTANAPVWYIDDKELELVFMVGFFQFYRGDYEGAKNTWGKVLILARDVASMPKFMPNVNTRLMAACRNKYMQYDDSELSGLDKDLRLRFKYAEFLVLRERTSEGEFQYRNISQMSQNEFGRAAALTGIAYARSLDLKNWDNQQWVEPYFVNALKDKKVVNSPLGAYIQYRYLDYLYNFPNRRKDFHSKTEEYKKIHSKSRHYINVLSNEATAYALDQRFDKAWKIAEKIKGMNQDTYNVLSWGIKDVERIVEETKPKRKE